MANSPIEYPYSDTQFLGDAQYIYGRFVVTQTSSITTRIQDFLNQIDTGSKYTIFDVIIDGGGRSHFHGFVYPEKNYGGGLYILYGGNISSWGRNNNTDTIRTILS